MGTGKPSASMACRRVHGAVLLRRFPAPAGRATRRRRCRTKEAIRPGRDPARPRAPASAPRQCRCSRRCRRTEPNGVPACRGDNAITGRDSLPVRRSVAAVTRMAAGSVGVSALSTQAAAWPRSNNPCTACRRQRPNPSTPAGADTDPSARIRDVPGARCGISVSSVPRAQRRHSRRPVRTLPRRAWSRSCHARRRHSAELPAPVSAEGRAVSWSSRHEGILPILP